MYHTKTGNNNITMETSVEFPFSELIPGLPDELGLECLTRTHFSTHRVAARVSRRWRSLFQSKEFYNHRRKTGRTRKLACIVQARRNPGQNSAKPAASHGLVAFDPVESRWFRVDPVQNYPDGLPLFCRVAGCDGKLVLLGGWDPRSYEPVTDVFVFDFVAGRWREGRKMPEKRSFFAVGSDSGRVYVAGGHDVDKHALRSAWCYDLGRDEWAELGPMGCERDECEGFVYRGGFWVVSGYGTESQGRFEPSAEVYEFDTATWRRVEGAWEEGKCPRGCAKVWRDEERKVPSWGELGSDWVRVGSSGVGLGDRALVSGSGHHHGGPHKMFMVELKSGGQFGKLEEISVADEFSVPFQASCCVEI